MATTINELCEQRKGIHEQAKAILDRAEKEGRDLNTEERAEYDRLDSEIDKIGESIASKQADEKRRKKLADREALLSQARNPVGVRPNPTDSPLSGAKGADNKELIRDLRTHLTRSTSMGATRREALKELITAYNASAEMETLREVARKYISYGQNSLTMDERAALQMDVESAGGSLVMPEDFIARLIIGLDERVFMRQIATLLPLTNAESVGVPSLDADPDDADWTTELSTGTADTAMATGKRMLHPHPLAKSIKVSKTLLRRSAIPVESLVRDRLEFKFGVTQEKGFLTGSGAVQPLGVFTASNAGISTSRDVSTDNTTTAITADGLINAKYGLMSQYLASANLRWIFHRTAVRNIRKLKDGNGQYLWTAGLSGQPDRILEVPYEMSEYAPSTFTSQLYVGMIGDFSWYWIAESLRFELQRLDELYAATNQVGFIGRLEVDAMPVLEEAFVRVQLG